MLTADRIKALLNLKPLAVEGGFFSETYRSADTIARASLPLRYRQDKSSGTAIYFLLTPDTFSALHRLPTDEIYHFYLGDAVELLQLHPDGSGTVTVLGHDLLNGMHPQHIVPRNTWQGSRLRAGGAFALMGTTMAPGFDRGDFEGSDRQILLDAYPAYQDLILSLTR